MNKARAFHWPGVVKRDGQGAFSDAHVATVVVAMQKNIFCAGVAEHVDPRIARDFFRAVAPEHNFFLQVKHAHADLQPIEDVAIRLGISKGWHGARTAMPLISTSAKIPRTPEARGLCRNREFFAKAALKAGIAIGWAAWHFQGRGVARECHMQDSVEHLTSQVSSSGGGLPGRLDLNRDRGARYLGEIFLEGDS